MKGIGRVTESSTKVSYILVNDIESLVRLPIVHDIFSIIMKAN